MQVNYKSGQSLLVIVLLIAVVFTIIASASYRLTTETQSAKIQEETIRVLAAADSGIEKGLQQLDSMTIDAPQTFTSLGIGLSGIDSSESTVTVTSTGGQYFVSPLVRKDDQYTFYLSSYPFGSTYYTGANMYIYFGGGSSGCGAGRTVPAMELTTITSANAVNRTVVEPCAITPRVEGTTQSIAALPTPVTLPGYTESFRYQYLFTPPANTRVLILRSLYADTYLGFNTNSGSVNFPIQGRTITSEAVSTSGVSKIVTLFRSNPQLPADFFVTTF